MQAWLPLWEEAEPAGLLEPGSPSRPPTRFADTASQSKLTKAVGGYRSTGSQPSCWPSQRAIELLGSARSRQPPKSQKRPCRPDCPTGVTAQRRGMDERSSYASVGTSVQPQDNSATHHPHSIHSLILDPADVLREVYGQSDCDLSIAGHANLPPPTERPHKRAATELPSRQEPVLRYWAVLQRPDYETASTRPGRVYAWKTYCLHRTCFPPIFSPDGRSMSRLSSHETICTGSQLCHALQVACRSTPNLALPCENTRHGLLYRTPLASCVFLNPTSLTLSFNFSSRRLVR